MVIISALLILPFLLRVLGVFGEGFESESALLIPNWGHQWQITTEPTNESSWRFIDEATHATLDYVPPTAATYYVRRFSTLGDCSDISARSKIVATPSLISFMSNDEKHLVIDHKNPFTITAGILTGDPHRTYQWQRSLDKSTWTNITPDGTNETYTETMSHAPTVYYRRSLRQARAKL